MHILFSPLLCCPSKRRSLNLRFWWLLLTTVMFCSSVQAVGVQPMVFELEPLGPNSRTVMSITNDGGAPLSIEAVPHRMTLDQAGNETRKPGDEDLLIFPPVALIPAGETQTIQVQYVGDPEIQQSQSYRVSIMQVAVKLEGSGQSGMAVAANFHTLLNVVPAGSSSKLSVEAIAKSEADGKWRMTINNSGNRFARLSRTRWTLQSGGKTVEMAPNEVAQRAEGNLVLPDASLDILFAAPDDFDPADTTVAIQSK